MEKSANSFLKPSLNWLLVFIPVTLFEEEMRLSTQDIN